MLLLYLKKCKKSTTTDNNRMGINLFPRNVQNIVCSAVTTTVVDAITCLEYIIIKFSHFDTDIINQVFNLMAVGRK